MNDMQKKNAVRQMKADENQRTSFKKFNLSTYNTPSYKEHHKEQNQKKEKEKQDLRGFQIVYNWFSKSGAEKRHDQHEKTLHDTVMNNFKRWKHLDSANELFNDPAFLKTLFGGFWIVGTIIFLWVEYMLSNIGSSLYDRPNKYTFLETLNPFYCYGLKIFFVCAMAAASIYLWLCIHHRFRDLNIAQEGSAKWATHEDIARDYYLVDIRDHFQGCGGVPIYWEDDHHVYIDNDKAKHTLIVGKTASGKTQTQVDSMIYLFAMAKEKSSMLINDAKLELATAFMPFLQEQGYEVILINMVDSLYSMGFNPLAIVVQLYRQGEEENIHELIEEAKNFALKFCYSVFHPDEPCGSGNEKYFKDSSTALLSGLIMAQTKDAIDADRELNRNRRLNFEDDQKRKMMLAVNQLSDDDRRTYFVQQFYEKQRVFCSSARAEQKTISKFNTDYDKEDIVKMIHAKRISIPYKKEVFKEIHPNAERVTVYSIMRMINKLTGEKVPNTEKNMLDIYFSEREDGDLGKELYSTAQSASEKTKGNIYSTLHTDMQGFNYESIAKITAKMDIDYMEIGYGRKPVAIFLGLPDYNPSIHFLATAFIDQLLYSLTSNAAHSPGATLPRRFAFILDEFGNMPPLNGFANTITVARSRNISLIMAIQSYSQLDKLYGKEDSVTISGNCANQIYIKSADNESNERMSKLLGNTTIMVRNRTGSSRPWHLKAEETEMAKSRPLLYADELARLIFGEQIVYRVDTSSSFNPANIKTGRKKRKNKPLPRPLPIYCTYDTDTGENHLMRPAFQYLSGIMPKKGQMLYESRITEMLYRRLHDEREELIRENHEIYLQRVAAQGKKNVPPEPVIPHLPLHPEVIPGIKIPKLQRLDLSKHLYPVNEWLKMYNMTYQMYKETYGEDLHLKSLIMASGRIQKTDNPQDMNKQIDGFPIRMVYKTLNHELHSPQDAVFSQAFAIMKNLMPTVMNIESGNKRIWHFLKDMIPAEKEDMNITPPKTPEPPSPQAKTKSAAAVDIDKQKNETPPPQEQEAPPQITNFRTTRRSVRRRVRRH
jgi:type IV secretory pathway TraG/TraD family ATPase VirD4